MENSKIKLGQTEVEVYKKIKENGKEQTSVIIKGIIVQETSHFYRVYDDRPASKGGGAGADFAELFPIGNCKIVGELRNPIPIPAIFR